VKKIALSLFFLISMTYFYKVNAAWVEPGEQNLLVMQLETGRVVMQLAPEFAPKHVRNIKQLVKQKYFDGSVILRSQDKDKS